MAAVEEICQIPREDFCGPGKGRHILLAKEALVVSGQRVGANMRTISGITGLNLSTVTRRHDAAIQKMREDRTLRKTIVDIVALYEYKSPKSQA